MPFGKAREPAGFSIQITEEEALIRLGLSGPATAPFVSALRDAHQRLRLESRAILLVDDGLSALDTVAYGALVPWAASHRAAGFPWLLVTRMNGAGRMFQLAGLPSQEIVFRSEEEARASCIRRDPPDPVPDASSLAIEGLRPQ